MSYNARIIDEFAIRFGIQYIGNAPYRFEPSTKLGMKNGQWITVSDMLKAIEYTVRFIRATFDVDEQKYKETLSVLKFFNLRFLNKSSKAPRREAMHYLVEVVHEMEDMRAVDDEMKKENEKIALALDLLIDSFVRE